MMIKLQIDYFELEIGVFKIRNWRFKSPIPNQKNTNPQFNITNWQFYHHLVNSTFSYHYITHVSHLCHFNNFACFSQLGQFGNFDN